jgi:cytochrome c-type biogenesis protein CcmH/NrfG
VTTRDDVGATRTAGAIACIVACLGCAVTPTSNASLHVVDGLVVQSPPQSTTAYAAYLRARLALEAAPPQLDAAATQIQIALEAAPRDPQLWTVHGEIAAARGDGDEAVRSANRALELSKDYAPAKRLLARLGRGETVAGR